MNPTTHAPDDTALAQTHTQTQTLEGVIALRHSVRGFRSQPVAQPLLEHVFKLAQQAPSNCNVQPWRVYVASGAARDRVRARLLDAFDHGRSEAADFQPGNKFHDGYRSHQVQCALALYQEMGIGMDDKVGRRSAARRNYELFDAPHVAFIGMDLRFGPVVALDVGTYLQTLMLLLTGQGLASCSMGSLRHYPSVVRAELNVPNEIGLLCGVCFGYEDPSVPANRTRVPRSPLSDNVHFVNE